jgi:ABC-type lipoprotein export system ATPase subunit
MLKLTNISKTFNGRDYIISDFNYEFKPEKVVCLFGPSGCGKSTLLKMIAGIENPTSGKVEYNGKSICKFGMREYFSEICSYVPQKITLFSELTVKDYFKVVNNILPFQSDENFILDIQKSFQIDGLSDLSVNSLSGGQKQRLAIAIAMLGNKKIFLLDEPTAHLDKKLGMVVFDFFRLFIKDINGIAVVASHDEFIKDRSDNVIKLKVLY